MEIDSGEAGPVAEDSERARTVGSRNGVSYSVFCARNMDNITGELRDVG